jgi:alpha-D-ribose 1-methylphosphonate 5-triphosphate diphosphatase
MNPMICLQAGAVFDGRRLLTDASVLIDNDRIAAVAKGHVCPRTSLLIDMGDLLVMPGLVDLHCDAMEKCLEMRPGVLFEPDFAFQNLDQRLAACGITTFCHALSFADNELGLRAPEEAEKLVARIHHREHSGRCAVRHRIHARYEIGSERSAHAIERLIAAGQVDLLSFMDHTPGQGQFKTLQSYLDFYTRNYQVPKAEVMSMVDRKKNNRNRAWERAAHLAVKARAAGIPILSHDDDTSDKVDLVRRLHAGGCEFPIALEAAAAAREAGMHVFMGAPNLVRGASTNGHLKASEAVARGLCDGLISDYYPECLVQTPFIANETLSVGMEHALRLVSAGPAAFLQDGITGGCLRPGDSADLVVVDTSGAWKRVVQTWAAGRCVYKAGWRMQSIRGRSPLPEEAA